MNTKFEFSQVYPNEIDKQIDELNNNKANSSKIPTDKLKKAKDIACTYLTDCINSAIYESEFQKGRMLMNRLVLRGETNTKVKGQRLQTYQCVTIGIKNR